jgi:nucleotide-binding universal stress UspA family protein
MSTAAIEQPRSTLSNKSAESPHGPILVATDGTESSDAALRAGSLLEQRSGAEVVVISVLETMPVIGSEYGMIMPPPVETDEARRNGRMKRVRDQVVESGERASDWKIEVRDGNPPAAIARAAGEHGARVIVIGLGRHQLLDRLFGDETALHVLRQARTPVLAVPPDFDQLPERVVVATDFSAESVQAARLALQLLDTVTNVQLVHVAPRMALEADAFAAWMSVFREGMGPAFDRVKQDLAAPAAIIVETITRNGKPSRELLDHAESSGADLIVTGSRGAGLVNRILIGSTATGLLRGAQCAVLAVPAVVMEHDQSLTGSSSVAREEWAAELELFTKRNIGRVAALEIDDPELGCPSHRPRVCRTTAWQCCPDSRGPGPPRACKLRCSSSKWPRSLMEARRAVGRCEGTRTRNSAGSFL